MVRALSGAALLISALGTAAALVVPSLSNTPGGEIMVVRGSPTGSVHEVRFEAADCLGPLLLGDMRAASSSQVLTLTFRNGPDGLAVLVADAPDPDALAEQTVIVLLDGSGKVVGAAPAPDFTFEHFHSSAASTCPVSDLDSPGLI